MNKQKHKPEAVIAAIEQAAGFKAVAARRLKVSRPTLDSYINRWDKVREAYEKFHEVELDES